MRRILLLFLLVAVSTFAEKANDTLPVPKPFPEPDPESEPLATTKSNVSPVPEPEPVAEPEPQPEPQPEPEPVRNVTHPKSHSSEKSAKRIAKIQFDIPSEDYGDITESAKGKQDEIETDAIQKLVESFLNPDEVKEKQRVNKEVEKLINSSSYWNLNDAKEPNYIKDEAMAQKWMNEYTTEAQKILYQVALAGWNYFTNVHHQNKESLDEAEDALAVFVKASSKQAKQFDLSKMMDPILRREFELLTTEGMSALDATKYAEFSDIYGKINREFVNSEICEYKGQNPCIIKFNDLSPILNNEKDLGKVSKLWKFWRDAASSKLASKYKRLMELTNEAAKLNGFPNGRDMWLSPFDVSSGGSPSKYDLMKSVDKIYEQILPFYQQIHAYMRRQLTAVFKDKNALSKDGPIPAHMLKSVSADNWSGHYLETKPFEDNEGHAEEMLSNFNRLNYTSKTMFIQAYRYFKYLGFGKLPASFWKNSVFTRSWSKDMLCNPPAAYDMRDGNDFRVKACSQLGETDFKLAHKLMVQVFYQYQYKKQPLPFREAANPSLQTAIANAFGVLSTNYDYLKSADLLADDTVKGEAVRINNLYREALLNVVKLPLDIVADKWRFSVFEGSVNSTNWNDEWWKLRTQYQGVKAPFERKNTAFDPIANSIIAQGHSPAVRNVVSYVLQFQILKALCPNTTSLDQGCLPDKEVVANLKRVMMQGASINWLEALEQITGEKELDAKALLDYYAPLISWLSNTNEHDEIYLGWDGQGAPFADSDVPVARSSDEASEQFIVPSEDQVAYPGGDCSKGQECLLDSTCNGKICECNKGLFTFRAGNSVTCISDDPATYGFGPGGSGLSIGLSPAENVSTPAPASEEHPKHAHNHTKPMHHPAKSSLSASLSVLLLPLLALLLIC